MPWFSFNWLIEALVVLLYFPLMVSLGAGAQPSSRLRSICVFSGKISYPLYMTHYAVMWMWGNYYNSNKPAADQLFLIIIPAVLLLIGFAYIAMKWYDEPVRKYLTKKRYKG
jgi:peptidoglycan/LPS O-acetylase OafA/YrhL